MTATFQFQIVGHLRMMFVVTDNMHDLAYYRFISTPIPLCSIHAHWTRLSMHATEFNEDGTRLDRTSQVVEILDGMDPHMREHIIDRIIDLVDPAHNTIRPPSYNTEHRGRPAVNDWTKNLLILLNWFGPTAPKEHWMEAMTLGIVIATRYNLVLHTFDKNVYGCFTHLPLRSPPVLVEYRREIAIARVNNDHFVQAFLQPHYPVPPIPTWWEENAWTKL
ncbi:hypothetical protein RHMOL_Rhmol01G0220600 [Rhododendron molle]|uniref:Uncharacterized protein n=1 Tax=Rhododendron molle TaxID=49168 RepID=A0ACC0Q3S4_RHOML|nr:hypothetical protein RHMOL_Rhmol01G0220600 [Rhododendron molle]